MSGNVNSLCNSVLPKTFDSEAPDALLGVFTGGLECSAVGTCSGSAEVGPHCQSECLALLADAFNTAAGDLSRNRTVGIRLGKGEKLQDIIDSMKAVAEGVLTSRSAFQLAQ